MFHCVHFSSSMPSHHHNLYGHKILFMYVVTFIFSVIKYLFSNYRNYR